MIAYLVINENENAALLPFAEKYQLFKDSQKALTHAKSIGFSTHFMEPTFEVGMKNTSMSGNESVSILTLEIQE